MKRLVLALATVVAAVAVPAASAQTPAGDSVTGQICDLVFSSEPCRLATFFEADARSGPSGENPAGTAAWGTRAGTQLFGDSGPVSCLAVSGNTAIVGFSGLRPFGRTLVRVIDGGDSPGADSFEALTQASLGLVFAIPPPDCSSFPPGPAGDVAFGRSGRNELGDIVVTDAHPLPTTKEQCKNGGWKSYGVFKNQGDCVSFVATKGTNSPAQQPPTG